MVKETALNAIKIGSMTLISGDVANPAVEIPNNEATGLAQTPTQAPLLQQANSKGMMELTLPVIDNQIDLSLFMLCGFK